MQVFPNFFDIRSKFFLFFSTKLENLFITPLTFGTIFDESKLPTLCSKFKPYDRT